ncbi:MAG: hypothetical protein ABI652_00645 [Acidobacteriota bacterium]
MRTAVVDKNNLQALTKILAGTTSTGTGATDGAVSALDQLKRLNPHTDVTRIEVGTVLLLPDTPAFAGADGLSVTGDPFSELTDHILSSVEVVSARVRAGHEALAVEQKEVAAVLKLAAVKRALEADPDLKAQIELANQAYKQDQQRAADSEKALRVLQLAKNELGELGKVIG